ncbi:glucose transporter, putative [Bodo saltans]|uniref:Glucose transporter, putative n=1 Tax=Bodo saltans TaxID=75058 RepID=A0A0S4JH90_BODSA|nr:glucose transporter, putative [Bodo saltans]|eukprot:CUG89880.1 glucose transporter, putative [Bodo saltans]
MGLDYVKGFFTIAVLKIAFINLVCGILVGVCYGFVPVHTTFITIAENCTLYESQDACATAIGTTCHWGPSTNITSNKNKCLFPELVDCHTLDHTSPDECSQLSYCTWSYADSLCQHAAGYTAVQSGIFSGAMVIGALIGSSAMGQIVNRLGRKKAIAICGACALLCSVVVHAASATLLYGLLIPARLFLGVVVGGLCCVGPMYVDEMVPQDYRNPVGMLFQVFFTGGMLLASLLGFLLNPTDFTVDVKMAIRLQGLDAFPTLASLAVLITGLFMRESTKWVKDGGSAPVTATETLQLLIKTSYEPTKHHQQVQQYSWRDMKLELFVALALGMAQQMTGSNAIFNYAPNITKSMNLQPLTGNLLVMGWNFFCSVLSIPLSSKFSMRQMFLTATMAASLSGLMTGIPVYPGVTTEDTRSALAAVGIALFLLAYEIGIGTCFFVLAQIMFPESFRARGSSFAMVSMFLFNITVTICFPIAVEALSGGPSGDQNKGMGITFMFFGVCGLVSWGILYNFLKPYEA